MKKFHYVLFLLFLYKLHSFSTPNNTAAAMDTLSAVDTTIEKVLSDIDFDGSNDTLFITILGESWNKPFRVLYTIKSKQVTIFSQEYEENVIDEVFGGDYELDFCDDTEYFLCKKKWYFELLVDKVTFSVQVNDDRRENLFDTTNDMALPAVLKSVYIDSLKYSPSQAADEADKMVNRLKTSPLTFFTLQPHPVYAAFPCMYEPISKRMIIIMGF